MTAASEQQAYLDGSCACLRNRPHSANPHPLGSPESRRWVAGYREIEQKRTAR